MFRVTLANIRAHRARLVAVSIAVILAVGFMAATLLLASSTQATLRATIGETYSKADVVVKAHDESFLTSYDFTPDVVDEIASLPGVSVVAPVRGTGVRVEGANGVEHYASLGQTIPAALDATEFLSGRAATSAHEVTVDEPSVEALDNVEIGDEIVVSLTGTDLSTSHSLTIVGITALSKDPFAGGTVNLSGSPDLVDTLLADGEEQFSNVTEVLVQLEGTHTVDAFTEAVHGLRIEPAFSELEEHELSSLNPVVKTPDEIVDETVRGFTEDTNMLTAVLLAFVGIALFVAGLVIANTFSVLVAQRARELALLRCVGASSKQIYRSVLGEALVMGAVASALGVGLGVALIAGLIWGSGGLGLTRGVGVFAMSWQAIVFPMLAGILVTLVAANGPAREATRVSPLEAMRTRSADELTGKAGRIRLMVGIIALSIGIAILAVSVFIDEPVLALLVALGGSIVSAVGVLMLAVFVIPKVTHLLGRIIGAGAPGKLAARNTIRNPKRTAATVSALLVGVTLVATVYTGAEVARATLENELAASFPVDMATVVYHDEHQEAQRAAMEDHLDTLRDIDGVEAVVAASEGFVTTTPDASIHNLWGMDPADFALVTRDERAVLTSGEALLGTPLPGDAKEASFVGEAGTLTMPAQQAGAPRYTAIVTTEDFGEIAGAVGTGEQSTWVALMKLDDGLGAREILEVRDELTALIPLSHVIGEGVERAMFDEILQMLLLIVTGLLAVAIVIAVIGIGNTLSLSVIERTRENALMRALGLTRGQLRGMLATEALLTSVTAALLGVMLGVGYGFLGANAVLSPFGEVAFGVPWAALAVIIGAALVAGLIASVIPARRAVKLSPVEGLRSD